jgi:2-phospho-L-lactate guanylyltransferase
VIVPVKALDQAKRRLAVRLPDSARRRLVLAMLEDVLATLARVREVGDVLVVTPDPRVGELAQAAGAALLQETGAEGLNAAVANGIACARSRGAERVLVLPGDVPLATPAELEGLIASRGVQPGVTLAPSHDGNGTNALLLAPPGAIAPCFGPGSYLAHLSQAMARRVDVNVVHTVGLARDIDEPADLHVLMANAVLRERYGFLGPHLAAPVHEPSRTTAVEEP